MRQSRFKRICVFCGSSQGKKRSYHDAAIELGNELVWYPTPSIFHPRRRRPAPVEPCSCVRAKFAGARARSRHTRVHELATSIVICSLHAHART
jgi:hypothetical protein